MNKDYYKLLGMIIIIVFAIFIGSMAANASLNLDKNAKLEKGNVRVTMVSQSPDPVEPGEYVDIRFKIENFGEEEIPNVKFILDYKYPFSLRDPSEAVINYGTINPRQTGDRAIILHWKVKVDENAVQGDNEIKLKYQMYYGNITFDEFYVRVESRESLLSLEKVDITPTEIYPGNEFEMTLNFDNLKDQRLENIKVSLNLENLPFSPVFSSSEKVIPSILPKSKQSVTFKLIADATAVSKVHQIPVTVTYTNKFNEPFTINTKVGITIKEKPRYFINVEEYDAYIKNKKGKIILSVSNIGNSQMNFVTLTLKDTINYKVLTSNKVYFGNLESDDFETGEYEIYIENTKNTTNNIIPLKVELFYTDSFNNDHVIEEIVPIKIYSSSEAKKYGLIKGGSSIGLWILVVIIFIVGFFIYKRYSRKKRAK